MQTINIALRIMSPLPWLCLLLSAVLCAALPVRAEKPKFATIEISRAYEAYHKTVALKEKLKAARAKLAKDPRRETIKLLEVEIKDLKLQVKDPTTSETLRKENYRRFLIKNHELVSLRRDQKETFGEQLKLINAEKVKKTYELLDDVNAVVQKIAEDGGFDYVFEVSGRTSSQLPTLLYIRDAIDITDQAIAILNRGKLRDEVATTESP